MHRKKEMPGAGGGVSRYYHTSYSRAMQQIERDGGRIFEVIRRAWHCSPEQAAQLIGRAAARSQGMTFDEVLFWLWEQLCNHGSGSISVYLSKPLILESHR
jgi:hypothetical protein